MTPSYPTVGNTTTGRWTVATTTEDWHSGFWPGTLWLLAQLDNADGRLLRAASYVDRIAEVAADYGDPVLQSRALLEVTALYAGARAHQAAADRLERLRPLLDSPHLSAEFRAEAQARLHL